MEISPNESVRCKVDLEFSKLPDGSVVPEGYCPPCNGAAVKVFSVAGTIVALCAKHEYLEWLILAAMAEKAIPDA